MEGNNKKIGLVVDEAFDLPQEMAEENKISVVKFKLDFQELAEMPGNIYQKIREGERRGMNSLIKTSQPSINDFLSAFKEKLNEFEQILCIAFSSKVSGVYNSACQAKKFLSQELQERVHIFDSMTGSGAQGLLVMKAISMIKEGQNIPQIIEGLKEEMPNIKLLGAYKTAKWLEASGRVPKFLPFLIKGGEKISLKPIFGMRDGKLTIVNIKKDAKDLASIMFEEFEKATRKAREAGRKIKVAITHADDLEEANNLKNKILSLENTEIAFINLTCFPIGGHIGPGSIVLSWNQ